jgi:glycosyltransferase involved in cell wall biosynthesis
MKVATIAPTFIPARRANTLQVMKMTQAFANLGNEVRLAVPEVSGDTRGGDHNWSSLSHHYGLDNQFPIAWLPSSPRLRKYDYAWYAVRWARKWSADVIYTRLPQAAVIAAKLGQITILEVHDCPQGTMGPILFRMFLKGRGARRLVVISKVLTTDLRTEFGSPEAPPFTQIIPDGVDLTRYTNLPEPLESRRELIENFILLDDKLETSFLAERFTAGYTGHLYPGRGISLLLKLAQRLPEMNFLIVGGEPLDVNRVRRSVVELKLQNVTLTGFVPNSDLPRYQSACDVLLMPYQRRVSASSGGDISRYLSPMKLFEYLACGRAICSSDLPVLSEVLSSDIAILLQPDNVNAWVTALHELSGDPLRRKDLAIRAQRAAGNYSWENRARQILSGIQEGYPE